MTIIHLDIIDFNINKLLVGQSILSQEIEKINEWNDLFFQEYLNFVYGDFAREVLRVDLIEAQTGWMWDNIHGWINPMIYFLENEFWIMHSNIQ
jgi:hypothetical protein